MAARMVLFVCVSLMTLTVKVFTQSQFLRWCVEENGVCHHNWECCDKMLCSDHFGVGKCIPLAQYPGAWSLHGWLQPPAFPAGPAWYGPFPTLKPKKKKKKKKKKMKIFIKVAGDLTGLTVKAKKKSSSLTKVKRQTGTTEG